MPLAEVNGVRLEVQNAGHGAPIVLVVGSSFGGSIALGLAARRPDLIGSVCAHEPPLLALARDDPVVAEFTMGVGPAVSLIDRGEPEAGARLFVERVIAPGAWDDRRG